MSEVKDEKKGLSVISALAESHGMERPAFEAALKATCVPAGITDAQFAAFCMVAKQYNLNPLLKEIYAFPAKGGGIVPIVGVDGWCNLINSNPAHNGMEFEDKMEDGKLVAITCRIFRKDREHPTECTEYMSECKRDVEVWKKWPARMLRHKSVIQCARYAYSLSGIYDEDEAHRMDMIDVTPKEADKSPFQGKGSSTNRKDFTDSLNKMLSEVNSEDELNFVWEKNKPTVDAMRLSGNMRDDGCLIMIDTAFEMATARISTALKQLEHEKKLHGLDDIPEHLREGR